jgi:hypothetical protein
MTGNELFERIPVNVIDWGRLLFAFILLLTLIGFLGAYFYLSVTSSKESWDRIKDAFQVILPTITGTLGTVVAFYFGKARE